MPNNVYCLPFTCKVFSNGDTFAYVFQLTAIDEGINLEVLSIGNQMQMNQYDYGTFSRSSISKHV